MGGSRPLGGGCLLAAGTLAAEVAAARRLGLSLFGLPGQDHVGQAEFLEQPVDGLVEGLAADVLERGSRPWGRGRRWWARPSRRRAMAIGPPVLPPSNQDGQVICSLAIAACSSSRFLSLLMPTRANGLPSSLFTSDRSCGYMSRQGGHQSPQKSRTTTLPRKADKLHRHAAGVQALRSRERSWPTSRPTPSGNEAGPAPGSPARPSLLQASPARPGQGRRAVLALREGFTSRKSLSRRP